MHHQLKNIKEVLKNDLCISCGNCIDSNEKMVLNSKKGIFEPNLSDNNLKDHVRVKNCPGKGYPIDRMGRENLNDKPKYKFELGYFTEAYATTTNDIEIKEKASSGGIISTLALYLLENKYVDGVFLNSFEYTPKGPKAKSYIGYNKQDILESQGSKYCPTSTNSLISQVKNDNKKYLFIGTPCQVAGLKLSIKENLVLHDKFPFTIANFCGGYRDYRHLNNLIIKHKILPEDVCNFRFRGEGQPGKMIIKTNDNRIIKEAYPEYDQGTRIAKQKRCTFCVDATGELADFSCGDAWLDRFLQTEHPWSIVMARSSEANKLLKKLNSENKIKLRSIEDDEIIHSQSNNIESKKYRQYKRRILNKLLFNRLPSFDINYPKNYGNYMKEIKILLGKSKLRYIITDLLKR